jgi:uncharacterized protein (DUF488 family)
MQTAEFRDAVEHVAEQARLGRLAVMCAEAVPWRCHRSLIGDALQVRRFEVRHIMSAESTRLHVLTAFARVDGDRVSYPTL